MVKNTFYLRNKIVNLVQQRQKRFQNELYLNFLLEQKVFGIIVY